MLDATHTLFRHVTDADLASCLYPGMGKPPILATARLLQWCELIGRTTVEFARLDTPCPADRQEAPTPSGDLGPPAGP